MESDVLKADSASSTISDPQPRLASKQRYPFMLKRKWVHKLAAKEQTSTSNHEGALTTTDTTTDTEEAPSGSAVDSRINLMDLPPEVRLQILGEVLTPSEATFKQHGRWTSGSIIFACKKLYEKGQPIGLAKNTFKRADLPKRYIVQGLGGVFDHMERNDRYLAPAVVFRH